ncbi:MAG: ParB N-terminal domain-containing protein [Spirochaetales bacterium]|nr:ParB N-terminal domain-containing protein [Spirochaetales bacterium]
MLIASDSIIVKNRIRRDVGDIKGLMESLKKHGQLTPIIVTRNNELIAGFRRLEAAKRLGWKSIEAVILDRPSQQKKLEIEIEENVQRQDLSAEELAKGLLRLQKLRQPGLLARIWNFILPLLRAIFRRNRPPR